MKKHSLSGSHPEEHYVPATRERMHLDKPTSHGGWPEGEYDPPVRDRIYGWYKKMKMMPEGEEPKMRDTGSSEQLRDLQKGRHGRKQGYMSDPESEAIARDLAQQMLMSDDPEGTEAFSFIMQHPRYAMNVWSELQSEGQYALARLVRPIADEYVDQRGKHMRITESMLRRIVREEYRILNEETARNEAAIAAIKQCWDSAITEKALAAKLKSLNVVGEIPILEQADAAYMDERKKGKFSGGDIDWIHGFSVRIAQMQGMNESQRGNDQNSQHDNDTDPGDPYAKKLKEARRLALKGAIMAEINKRRSR
jgi:hypothetical protein